VADNVALDVAITWAGAVGCAYYLYSLYAHGRPGLGAQRFLMLLLTSLLFVRGLAWLSGDAVVKRLTFALACWLPLAVTLFIERILRRHHPLGLKVVALATSVTFFLLDAAVGLPGHRAWLMAFLTCFALVLLGNGMLLFARRSGDLGAGEERLAGLLLVIALISVPLVVSDFRTVTGAGTVRIGAIAALLLVYGMLGSVLRTASPAAWLLRFSVLLVPAFVLSGLIGLAMRGMDAAAWRSATMRTWPVAYAWLLLTGIVVSARAVRSEGSAEQFLGWLARARLDSTENFLSEIGGSPDAATHLVLGPDDLADYRPDVLARLPDAHRGVASLASAREQRNAGGDGLTESAEQWIDLFERTQMTHGFLAARGRPKVVLVSLPGATPSVAAELRLSVMEHIARQLERG
jgi:hypothetical protein